MQYRILLFALVLALTSAPALANIRALVHISSQTMEVIVDGDVRYRWPVSTAAPGKVTPTGTFKPYWLSEKHRSRLYNWTPMPHAVFYDGDYAIHGTFAEHLIGTPTSNGCVRLMRDDAKVFFELVRQYGYHRVTIVIAK